MKAAADRYREGKRGWLKVKRRTTTEMIMGVVSGPVQAPRTLILGRYEHGRRRLRVVARSAPLPGPARWELAGLLAPAGDEYPWPSRCLPAGSVGCPVPRSPSGTRGWVLPEMVAETAVDAAVEHGRWRHAVRYVRVRADLAPRDVREGVDIE